jgi:TonB family protein
LNRGVIFNPGDEYLYLVDADFKKEGNGYEIVDGTVTLASTERVGTKQLAPENSQQALPPPDPVPAQSQSTAAVAGAMPSASSSPRGQPNATQSQSESSPIVAVIQAAERNDWASVDSQVEVLMQEIPTIQHGDRALAKRLNAQAISLLNQDDFQAGIEALVGASKADPADIEVSNNLGYAYQKAGLNTQAFEILNRTLSQSPRRASAWENLARVYAQSGETAASEACARITLRFSKNPTATIAFMKKIVSDDPDSPYGKVLATVIQGPPVQQSAFSSHEQSSSASSPDTNRHATNTDEPMQDADPIWIVHTVAHYPPQAVRQHHTGVVVLMVTIDANGNPADIKVDQSSGFRELDRAAMDAAQRWRFKPAIKGGRAVESYMRVPANFSLNDRAGN